MLLTLALLGGAVRMGAIWAATVISDYDNTLGVLMLVLAPLGSVTAIVLMLYALRGSLPHIASAGSSTAPDDALRHRERRLIDMLASVLVPFLAVYASYGLLKEDTDRYINAVAADEFLANADIFYRPDNGIDVNRFVFATGWAAVAVVVGALIFRFGLTKLEGARRWAALGFIGAYVEVLWLTTLAAHVTIYQNTLWDWVESRRGVEIFVDSWLDLLDVIGPAANPVDYAADWLLGVLGNFDAIVVVPVAWLTVGAVVYGHKLVPPPEPSERELPIMAKVPPVVRRWGGELFADVKDRFAGLFGGLRQLAVAGLGPMLIFGLAFLASARLEDGLNLLARHLIGPREVDTWLAFSPHVTTVTRAIGLTVTMCLLAAAVDRVLARSSGPQPSVQPETANET